MKAEPVKVCMKCHKEPIEAADGRKVAAVAEVLDPKMVKHGPIQQGNCAGCHNVHGSNVQKLLLKQYPATFYAPFKMEDYDLCFTCHTKQLVTLEKTESLTNFRDGDRSLHFVHVNKAERGRTCRACHEAHASPNPLEIRTAVPYGNWQMPLNFKKTETGGSCAPGCHKPFNYDRTNAANLPTTMPTAPPSAPTQPPVAADARNQQS
jgi:predicted CXXCH cytochrome family protein